MHYLAVDTIVAYLLLRNVFTGLLLRNECPVVGCALVGRYLPIRFLETAQIVMILIRNLTACLP